MEIVGLDLLTNPAMAEGSGGTINLDSFDLPELSAPKLVSTNDSSGPSETWNGVENMNAQESYIPKSSSNSSSNMYRMSDEMNQRKKYETLRKFDRLAKLGVPLRKRFTMDSTLEEMEMEMEFLRKEKDMDRTVQQFSEWFVTGMGGLEWSSKNVALVKAFGLKLDGLSEAAQMKVGDMEEDFEELYDLYGDKLKMHPLVRIPIRTCMMVYMVHLTNEMVQKSPIPNIDTILKTNPDIARQLATAAMQNQAQSRSAPQSQSQSQSNPLAGLQNFMGSMMPPQQAPAFKSPIKIQRPNPQPPVAQVQKLEMKPPSIPTDINELLKSVGVPEKTDKKVSLTPAKKGGSTGKNSVSIKL
jgi:hypothetical protein